MRTAEDGKFSFDALPDGDYQVLATHAEFNTVSVGSIRISFPLQTVWNPSLRVAMVGTEGGRSSDLVGELTAGGAPMAGATVCPAAEGRRICTATNRFGQYFVAAVPGLYTVTVGTKEGLRSEQVLDMRQPGMYRNRIVIAQVR